MPAKKTAKKPAAAKAPAAKEVAAEAPTVTGATSGVAAVGDVGRAARAASHSGSVEVTSVVAKTWRDPAWTPAENDQSIDARMRRLTQGLRG